MPLDCRQQNMFWSFQIVLSCLGSTNATVHENNGKHVAFRLYFLCSIAHNSICIWQKCLNITEENSISTRDQKNLKHPKLHFTRPEGDRNREPMWPVRKSGGPLRTPSFSDRFRRLYLKSQKKIKFFSRIFWTDWNQHKMSHLNFHLFENQLQKSYLNFRMVKIAHVDFWRENS